MKMLFPVAAVSSLLLAMPSMVAAQQCTQCSRQASVEACVQCSLKSQKAKQMGYGRWHSALVPEAPAGLWSEEIVFRIATAAGTFVGFKMSSLSASW